MHIGASVRNDRPRFELGVNRSLAQSQKCAVTIGGVTTQTKAMLRTVVRSIVPAAAPS